MKKTIYSLITKFGGMIAAFAVVATSLSANSTCAWIAYQDEEPEEVKAEFKKLYVREHLNTYIDFGLVDRLKEVARVNVEQAKIPPASDGVDVNGLVDDDL